MTVTYLHGDPNTFADVEQRWVTCASFGDGCGFEGSREVEFLDRTTFQFTCPGCGALQDDEIGDRS